MNKYDCIVIFRPDLEEKKLEEECAKVEAVFGKHQAKVEKAEKWGKRRLTFEIKKFHEGFFFYIALDSAPDKIKTFTDLFKIDNNILRSQIVRKEA